MNRIAKSLFLLVSLASLCAGCANALEKRTIAQWMEEIEQEDLAKVRDRSSDKFDEMAFPLSKPAEPFAALKVLKLPKGDITIKNVQDDDVNKKVVVEVGDKDQRKTELVFTLIPDGDSGKWVVDDVYRSEMQRTGKKSYRSVAEQMNLLLAVQEFDYIWTNGDRQQVLGTCTTRLARLLGELPPPDLDHILTSVHGKGRAAGKFKPQARMAEDTAEVAMNKNGRAIVAAYRNVDGRWLVDNVAVSISEKGRGEYRDIPSIQDLASVLITTNSFRTAYDGNDKQALEQVTTSQFFKGALAAADLRSFKLPQLDNVEQENRTIDIVEGHAEFVLRDADNVLQISLTRNDDDAPNAARTYRVDDVAIWQDRQEKRLAAVFTSQQAMQVFSHALAERDLKTLHFLSTRDFRHRVWDRLTPETIYDLPLTDIPNAAPISENVVFRGPLTEVTVTQGDKPITYVMRALHGEMKVDDVLFPTQGRPDSLKETAEIMIPIYDFAAGFRLNNLELLARNSSRELNRMAWSQCRRIPHLNIAPDSHLKMPLHRVENSNPESVQVVMGDQKLGAVVWLVKENDAYRIDDMRLIQGPDERRDQVQLKQHVRLTLAQGETAPTEMQTIVPADFDVINDELFPETVGQDGQVQQASGSEVGFQRD